MISGARPTHSSRETEDFRTRSYVLPPASALHLPAGRGPVRRTQRAPGVSDKLEFSRTSRCRTAPDPRDFPAWAERTHLADLDEDFSTTANARGRCPLPELVENPPPPPGKGRFGHMLGRPPPFGPDATSGHGPDQRPERLPPARGLARGRWKHFFRQSVFDWSCPAPAVVALRRAAGAEVGPRRRRPRPANPDPPPDRCRTTLCSSNIPEVSRRVKAARCRGCSKRTTSLLSAQPRPAGPYDRVDSSERWLLPADLPAACSRVLRATAAGRHA